MPRHPYGNRRLTAPATGGTSMKLTTPLPIRQGGNGKDSLFGIASGSGSTTVFAIDAAPLSNFDSGALGLNDRFNGLKLTTGGRIVTITDYVGATRTFTVEPALPATPTAGDVVKVAADIPRMVSELVLKNVDLTDGDDLLVSRTTPAIIANGMSWTILADENTTNPFGPNTLTLIDEDWGTAGFDVFVESVSAQTILFEMIVSVP